jgi:ABC-type multidrug transport system fused ATPase/permease subunit
MNDLEKSKDVPEVQRDYGSNFNESKNFEASESTSFKDKIVERAAKAINEPAIRDASHTDSVRVSNNIRTILMGLFTLIGFIILVFAIFSAIVGVDLAQTATSVFLTALIAAIVGTFALFAFFIYHVRDKVS